MLRWLLCARGGCGAAAVMVRSAAVTARMMRDGGENGGGTAAAVMEMARWLRRTAGTVRGAAMLMVVSGLVLLRERWRSKLGMECDAVVLWRRAAEVGSASSLRNAEKMVFMESAAMVVRIKLHGGEVVDRVRCAGSRDGVRHETVRKMVAQGAEMVEVGCVTELLDARRRWRCCSWWPKDVKVRWRWRLKFLASCSGGRRGDGGGGCHGGWKGN